MVKQRKNIQKFQRRDKKNLKSLLCKKGHIYNYLRKREELAKKTVSINLYNLIFTTS